MTLLMIALGAAVGAPARYLTDRLVQSRHESVLPWGTLCVNVIGSFILGVGVLVTIVNVGMLLGTAMCAASAAAFNQLWEVKVDAMMPRTASRPIVAGRMSGGAASAPRVRVRCHVASQHVRRHPRWG